MARFFGCQPLSLPGLSLGGAVSSSALAAWRSTLAWGGVWFRRGEAVSVPQRPDAGPVAGVLAVEAFEAVEAVPGLQVGGQLVLVVGVDVLVVLLVRRLGGTFLAEKHSWACSRMAPTPTRRGGLASHGLVEDEAHCVQDVYLWKG
jgi:hypothetical protein